MIITIGEYKEMGFDADDDRLLESCIKRAEFVLNGITNGRAGAVALGRNPAADYVKQAAAFQTRAIYREETAIAAGSTEESQTTTKSDERVTIGDFTYSGGSSSGTSHSTSSKSSSVTGIQPLDTSGTVIRLLRAAGCLCGATEVRE